MPRAFLSSTLTEMDAYRAEARKAIEKCGCEFVGMEEFAAADSTVEQYCCKKVRECEIFVLVLGSLYGSSPDKDGARISYTEREFDVASENPPAARFVFVPDLKAQLNTTQAGRRLKEAGYDMNRQYDDQKTFIERVIKGRQRQYFKSPDHLKDLIERTLTEHLQPLLRPAAPRLELVPVGRMLPLICDRKPQTGDFRLRFDKAGPGVPEIFVLHGRSEDQLASCVERLICLNILRQEKTVAPDAANRAVEPPAPSPPDPDEIVISRFLSDLFPILSRIYVTPRDPKPEHLCEAGAASGAPYIVLRHLFRVSTWTPRAQAFFMGPYLRVWDEVAKTYADQERWTAPPRFLIFLEFKHAVGEEAAFQNAIAALLHQRRSRRPAAAIHLLPPLTDVDEPALSTWLENLGNRLVPPFRGQQVEQLFPQIPLPMRDVETKLKTYLGLNT